MNLPKCLDLSCPGVLYNRGKNRSRRCSICGKTDGTKRRGRPPKLNKPKIDRTPRLVTYGLFDPNLAPKGLPGVIHQCAIVGTATGPSRISIERSHAGLRAIPFGRLSKNERRWFGKI